jgi:hypothetical protein
MKECPHCAKLLHNEATVCRFCGLDVSTQHMVEKNDKSLRKTLTNNWLVIIIAMIVGGIVYAYLIYYGLYIPEIVAEDIASLLVFFMQGAFLNGLLALFILFISGGSKKGRISAILLGPLIFTIIWIAVTLFVWFFYPG